MDLNSASVFVKVAQLESFSAAARALQMPVSTVSAKVAALEERLGVTLIRRTTRQLHLTEAGDRYFRHAVRAVAEILKAEESTAESNEKVEGLVRITGPVEMGSTTLADAVASFIAAHPGVRVEMLLTDRLVDLIGEGIDLALRAGELEDSSLVARRIGVSQFELYASPAYLKRAGTPAKPLDLKTHDCLGFHTPAEGTTWELARGTKSIKVPVRGSFSVNNLMSLHRVVSLGRGIAFLPSDFCKADLARGRLVRVLPEWCGERAPLHLVYAEQKFVPRRVRALVDHLAANLKEMF